MGVEVEGGHRQNGRRHIDGHAEIQHRLAPVAVGEGTEDQLADAEADHVADDDQLLVVHVVEVVVGLDGRQGPAA